MAGIARNVREPAADRTVDARAGERVRQPAHAKGAENPERAS
jgi:hypothetical protein